MIECLTGPPNHVQTRLRLGVVELAGQAFFLQALRELALREVLGEPTLRVLLERWTIAHQRSVLRQGLHGGTSMLVPSRSRLFLKEDA
jgi:hypothetical protein